MAASQEARARDVRTVDESGNMGEREDDEDEIPDMEDEEVCFYERIFYWIWETRCKLLIQN